MIISVLTAHQSFSAWKYDNKYSNHTKRRNIREELHMSENINLQENQPPYQQGMPSVRNQQKIRKKKGGCLKPVLIVIGAIIVLSVIAGVAGGSDPDKSEGTTASVTEGKKIDSTNKDDSAPSDGLYHVGDTYKGDGLSITYLEFGEYTGYDEWSKPADGMKVVYAKFYVENTGDRDVTVSYFDFNGYCDNKEVPQYYGIDNSGLDFSLSLSSGRNGTGTIAFEIPQNLTDLSKLEMEFTSDYWSDEKIKFMGEGDGTAVVADNITTESTGSGIADEEKYNVGDTYKGDSLNVTFTECGEYTDYNEYIPPADGNKIIYAKFEFENTGKSDEYVMYTDFNAFADNKNVNQYYASGDTENTAFSCDLSAGRSGSGTVMFEVPENSENIDIEFSPSFWSSKHVVFKYKE